ncbi:hypothetical protein PG994_006511 [Apiospora phragmitis]|uniref:Uncharacterized protein n=1 Tax=Apiospora phragmitis TaxID=2905665 RepID=A0ABR1VF97_9PEZI
MWTTVRSLGFLRASVYEPDHYARPSRRDTPRRGLEDRALVGGLLNTLHLDDILKLLALAIDLNIALNLLDMIQPAARSTAFEQVQSILQNTNSGNPTQDTFYRHLGCQVSAGLGLTTQASRFRTITAQEGKGEASPHSDNNPPVGAGVTIYPKKDESDVPEEHLRAAICKPQTFTYDKKPLVLFVPGTGSHGGSVYRKQPAQAAR